MWMMQHCTKKKTTLVRALCALSSRDCNFHGFLIAYHRAVSYRFSLIIFSRVYKRNNSMNNFLCNNVKHLEKKRTLHTFFQKVYLLF